MSHLFASISDIMPLHVQPKNRVVNFYFSPLSFCGIKLLLHISFHFYMCFKLHVTLLLFFF